MCATWYDLEAACVQCDFEVALCAVRVGASLKLVCDLVRLCLSLGLFWSALSLAVSGVNNGRCECA